MSVASGALAVISVNANGGGIVTYVDLPVGSCSLSEIVRTGWQLSKTRSANGLRTVPATG